MTTEERIQSELRSIKYHLSRNRHVSGGLLYDYTTYGDITDHILRIERILAENHKNHETNL